MFLSIFLSVFLGGCIPLPIDLVKSSYLWLYVWPSEPLLSEKVALSRNDPALTFIFFLSVVFVKSLLTKALLFKPDEIIAGW